MCSVVGYVGMKPSCPYILEGLKRLEYRGYDSAGLACFDKKESIFLCCKTIGDVRSLQAKIDDNYDTALIGIGHTRWATHGVATELNAHPHYNTEKTIFLVHNGIIENYNILKMRLLEQGHLFYSDTDSEIIAHLFEDACRATENPRQALLLVVQQLKGSFACVLMTRHAPDTLFAIRKNSPLCIGIGDKEMFVASDTLAFSEHVSQVLFMPDETCAAITQDKVDLYDFQGNEVQRELSCVKKEVSGSDKGSYNHFMLKEIYEQKRVLDDTILYMHNMRTHGICFYGALDHAMIINAHEIIFVACGTSAHAASIASFFFEEIALMRSDLVLASEFRSSRYGNNFPVMLCALSQSGETSDTLVAVRSVLANKIPVIAISNTLSSSLVRESHGYLITQAQREVAVAATKSFTAQLGLLFVWAHQIAWHKNYISREQVDQAEQALAGAARVMQACMERYAHDIKVTIAPRYAQYKNFIFLGRHISYPFACEAALKLKEIAYVFVDVYPAGELKHGPLALVDEQVPVFVFSVIDEDVYRKLVCAAQEVKARNGHLVVFAFEGQDELIHLADTVFIFPVVHRLLAPVAMTGLMQLLMYHVAAVLDRPIDRPRNLAKSVTVQ